MNQTGNPAYRNRSEDIHRFGGYRCLGYAFTHERHVQSADGFTVKYGYREDGSSVGFMTSLSYLYSDSNPKGDGIRGDSSKIIKNSDIKYFGVGPYWYVTPALSLYATAGVNPSGNDEFGSEYQDFAAHQRAL